MKRTNLRILIAAVCIAGIWTSVAPALNAQIPPAGPPHGKNKTACDTACDVSLGDSAGAPGEIVRIPCRFRNTGTCTKLFEWSAAQTGGNAAINVLPASGAVFLYPGETASPSIVADILATSPLGQAIAEIDVTADGLPMDQDQAIVSVKDPFLGGRIVWERYHIQSGQTELFVAENDGAGSPPRRISSGDWDPRQPAWSYDGRFIAYIVNDVITSHPPHYLNRLKIVDLAGNQLFNEALEVLLDESAQFGGYPTWSPDGKSIALTNFSTWGARGLMLVEFTAPYDFASATARTVISVDGPNATEPCYSSDGARIYFNVGEAGYGSGIHFIASSGGSIGQLFYNNDPSTPVSRAFDVSASPDGETVIYNSERFRDGLPGHFDEELVQFRLSTGIETLITSEPGNAYGSYALLGMGEIVISKNAKLGEEFEMFLHYKGTTIPFVTYDPTDGYDDHQPKWYKP